MVTEKGFTEWQLHKHVLNKDANINARAGYAYMAGMGIQCLVHGCTARNVKVCSAALMGGGI